MEKNTHTSKREERENGSSPASQQYKARNQERTYKQENAQFFVDFRLALIARGVKTEAKKNKHMHSTTKDPREEK